MWHYFSNKATSEPASVQLPNLSPHPIACHLVYRCQAHSWKCFQIRALPCSLFDSLMSTLSVPGIALGKFLPPLQNILSLPPRLAQFQLLGYVFGSLNSMSQRAETQLGGSMWGFPETPGVRREQPWHLCPSGMPSHAEDASAYEHISNKEKSYQCY